MNEKPANSASFKLSTLETLRADPEMKPIDHSLLGAYMQFMDWPARQAYLTNLKARILTGMTSEPTISDSRARLVLNGYLRHLLKKLNGADLYEINNPKAEKVAYHIIIAEETLKERDAYRKSEDRRKQALKLAGVKETFATVDSVDQRNFRDTTKETYDNSLDDTFQDKALRERPSSSNSYLASSRGR